MTEMLTAKRAVEILSCLDQDLILEVDCGDGPINTGITVGDALSYYVSMAMVYKIPGSLIAYARPGEDRRPVYAMTAAAAVVH